MESVQHAAKKRAVDVRRARPADAPVLAEIARVALPLGRSERDFFEEIERQPSGDVAVWLTEDGSGGAVVRLAADEAELLWIAVQPDSRRRGAGRCLLRAAAAWADERGATLLLEVRESSEAAVALYVDQGFVVVGRRARYYRDGEDALLFRRAASTSSGEFH